MKKEIILNLLKDYKQEDVEKFANYCLKILLEKDRKTGLPKNPWMQSKTEEALCGLFRRVNEEGLVLDGVHITLDSRGIQYDYIAYKNKMLLVYPETKIDIQLVYKDDIFNVAKETGKVIYSHSITNPFARDIKEIVGGYCIIQNKRGEFLTLLNKEEFENHKNIAKTDYIWKQWYAEMSFKTLVKKAVKLHFSDIYEKIEEEDNKNYDLEKEPAENKVENKEVKKFEEEIGKIKTLSELKLYYDTNSSLVKSKKVFNKLITDKKAELTPKQKTDEK